MSFLPSDYVAPTTNGSYFKVTKEKTKVRILAPAIVWYIDWDKTWEKPKPIRTKTQEKAFDPKQPPRHFWAFPIRNYTTEKVEIWEVSQATIRNQITTLVTSEWGNPMEYDLVVSKTGTTKDDTVYFVVTTPNGKTPVSAEIAEKFKETPVYLEALYDGLDPFELWLEKKKEADEAF